ncbi:MAG: hypothetical protein GWN31_12130, partial [Candidatus Thorarchaeota archaeon]|nr:hypothetical protein [Candidatus Thorarchaeota archaeon]NIW14646.1 hypothetical protein [Candidatus Thorarchaeota archaeon]NIW52722.1 hypothetical protein [Candidatus Korarchaeota archaeon]
MALILGLLFLDDQNPRRIIYPVLIGLASIFTFIGGGIGSSGISHIVLGATSLLAVYLFGKDRGFKNIGSGLILPLAIIEVSSLLSVSSFWVIGGWNSFFKNMVLKERLIWAPVEWVSIPILILAAWNQFSGLVLERRLGPQTFLQSMRARAHSIHEEEKSWGLDWLRFIAPVVVVILVILPHLSTVNPGLEPVSVDTYYYQSFFRRIDQVGEVEALKEALEWAGDVPSRALFFFGKP